MSTPIAERFRSFLPVVIDLETGGFNPESNAILEIAAVFLDYQGLELQPGKIMAFNVIPKSGTRVELASLQFTGINLDDPNRNAISEREALNVLFSEVRHEMKNQHCQRAILVAHNASFDQQFINAACQRNNLKRSPFHPFSALDTASLSALAYGHTVLHKACERAGIQFDNRQAHSAKYDAKVTAQLFCQIVNRWQQLGGWPLK